MVNRAAPDFFASKRAEFLDGARTLGWDEIWLQMANARFALIDALQDVSQEQADWSPNGAQDAGDESTWCIAEIMRHVITASPNITDIIAATANGRTVEKGPPGQIVQPEADVHELRALVTSVSERLLNVANAFPAGPDEINNETTVPHAFFGELPSKAWPLFQAFHDGDHTSQIEAIKASPSYPQ